jgi:hypothetical protein
MAHYTVQDPNGLAQRRQELEQARHIAVDAMNALAQVVNRTDWRGNTATRVLGSVDQQRRDLSNLVNELDVAIGAIDRHRVWCDLQRGELKRHETRVRAWIREFNSWPPDRQAASPVKPANLGALPVAFNTKWRDLFKFLRNKGIAV